MPGGRVEPPAHVYELRGVRLHMPRIAGHKRIAVRVGGTHGLSVGAEGLDAFHRATGLVRDDPGGAQVVAVKFVDTRIIILSDGQGAEVDDIPLPGPGTAGTGPFRQEQPSRSVGELPIIGSVGGVQQLHTQAAGEIGVGLRGPTEGGRTLPSQTIPCEAQLGHGTNRGADGCSLSVAIVKPIRDGSVGGGGGGLVACEGVECEVVEGGRNRPGGCGLGTGVVEVAIVGKGHREPHPCG